MIVVPLSSAQHTQVLRERWDSQRTRRSVVVGHYVSGITIPLEDFKRRVGCQGETVRREVWRNYSSE